MAKISIRQQAKRAAKHLESARKIYLGLPETVKPQAMWMLYEIDNARSAVLVIQALLDKPNELPDLSRQAA